MDRELDAMLRRVTDLRETANFSPKIACSVCKWTARSNDFERWSRGATYVPPRLSTAMLLEDDHGESCAAMKSEP